MEPIIQLFTLLFGLILGFLVYELTRHRVGGVIALTIMVIYTLENPVMLPVFLLSTALCLAGTTLLAQRTLLYGQRLLTLNLAVSIVCTSILIFSAGLVVYENSTSLMVGTIVPGIVSYTISRESLDVPAALKTSVMMTGYFLLVLLFALFLMALGGTYTP